MTAPSQGTLSIVGNDFSVSFKWNDEPRDFKGKLEGQAPKDFKNVKAIIFQTVPDAAHGPSSFAGSVEPAGIVVSLNDGLISVNAQLETDEAYSFAGEGSWND